MKDSLDNIPLFSDYSESDNEESAGAANPTIVPWVDPYFFHIVHSVCFFLPAACYKVIRLLKILYYEPYLIGISLHFSMLFYVPYTAYPYFSPRGSLFRYYHIPVKINGTKYLNCEINEFLSLQNSNEKYKLVPKPSVFRRMRYI